MSILIPAGFGLFLIVMMGFVTVFSVVFIAAMLVTRGNSRVRGRRGPDFPWWAPELFDASRNAENNPAEQQQNHHAHSTTDSSTHHSHQSHHHHHHHDTTSMPDSGSHHHHDMPAMPDMSSHHHSGGFDAGASGVSHHSH